MRSQKFLLQSTNGQHLSTQCDLAGHCDICAHRDLRQGRNQRRAHSDTSARAILGGGALWHVDMDVLLFMKIGSNAQADRPAANHRQRRGNRLAHHLAQRAGLGEPPFARYHSRLDRQQLATDLSPGQPGDLPYLILLFGEPVTELANTQEMLERIGIHNHMEAFLGRMLLDHLAAHLGQLALKAANTGLAGVVADDVPDSGFLEFQLALLQTIGLNLLGRQIPCGNVDLFVLGIAWQADDFHAVEQRRRNVHRVGGTEEHHVREVIVDLQIMIVEVVVLLRVQHLEQCRGRIAAHVAAHLVDLVEQEQRVAHAHLGHLLDQTARHGTDVGAAMAANLGFVTHTAQRHANKLAIGRTCNGFGEGRLADTGRPYQAEHRPLELLHTLLHGEILKDAVLDLFQTIVVGVEHLFCLGEVQPDLAGGFPRHVHQPVDIGPHYRRFGRHR